MRSFWFNVYPSFTWRTSDGLDKVVYNDPCVCRVYVVEGSNDTYIGLNMLHECIDIKIAVCTIKYVRRVPTLPVLTRKIY